MNNMGNWKAKKRRKVEAFSRGQTPGKKKDANRCQINATKTYMAKRSRSYKDPNYSDWCKWADSLV